MWKSMLKFHQEKIAEETSNHVLESTLANFAIRFAVLGQLDITRKLVGLLSEYDPLFHKRSVTLKPLQLVWYSTSNWPDYEHEKVDEVNKSVQDLAKEYLDELVEESRIDPPISEDIKGLQQIMDVIEDRTTHFEDRIRGTDEIASLSAALVRALDLRILLDENDQESDDGHSTQPRKKQKTESESEKQDQSEDLPSTLEILEKIAERLGNQTEQLIKSYRAWKLLKNGALADAAGITEIERNEIISLGEEVLTTFKRRFESGPELPKEDPMSELVKKVSENTRSSEGVKSFYAEMGEEDAIPETLLRDPASPKEIEDLEKRLDIQLPADYKDFLAVTNGLGSSWNGVILDPPLFPAEKVRWLEHNEIFADQIYIPGEEFLYICGEEFPDLPQTWPNVEQAIEIGMEDIDSVWLIPPSRVEAVRKACFKICDRKKASEELKKAANNHIVSFAGSREKFEKMDWAVVTWASGGSALMLGYPSFTAFMAKKARDSGRELYPVNE